MPEILAHAAHFRHRFDAVPHAKLRSPPRRELIAVGIAAREDRWHRQETLAAARLIRVAHAAFLETWSARICPQIQHVECTQRTHEHVEMFHIDRRQIELYKHYVCQPSSAFPHSTRPELRPSRSQKRRQNMLFSFRLRS